MNASPAGIADFSPLAYLYSAGIFLLFAAGCWAVWWAIARAIEWWIASHCPMAPDPVDAALERNQQAMPTLRPLTPGRPLDAYEQAILDRLEADLTRPRPGQIRRSKP